MSAILEFLTSAKSCRKLTKPCVSGGDQGVVSPKQSSISEILQKPLGILGFACKVQGVKTFCDFLTWTFRDTRKTLVFLTFSVPFQRTCGFTMYDCPVSVGGSSKTIENPCYTGPKPKKEKMRASLERVHIYNDNNIYIYI